MLIFTNRDLKTALRFRRSVVDLADALMEGSRVWLAGSMDAILGMPFSEFVRKGIDLRAGNGSLGSISE